MQMQTSSTPLLTAAALAEPPWDATASHRSTCTGRQDATALTAATPKHAGTYGICAIHPATG